MNAHIETGKELRDGATAVVLNEKEYHLAFDMNAMCDMEEKYGSMEKAFSALSSEAGMKDLRFMLWKALQHSAPEMTEAQAGQLVTLQNVNTVAEALGKAMDTSVESSGEKNEEDPQEV